MADPASKNLQYALSSVYDPVEWMRLQCIFAAWNKVGFENALLPYKTKFLVHIDQRLPKPEQDHWLKITEFSLARLISWETIETLEIDSKINQAIEEKYGYLVLLEAGTYILNVSKLLSDIATLQSDNSPKNTPVAGHILLRDVEPLVGASSDETLLTNFPNSISKTLPHLHKQFMILNLDWFASVGSPRLSPNQNGTIAFPAYACSERNIHDDYTPMWIRASTDKNQNVRGKARWGTSLIQAALDAKVEIINIPASIRENKMFSYPWFKKAKDRLAITATIESDIKSLRSKIYVKNTEPCCVPKVPNFRPERLVSVAGSFKTLKIIDEYWPNEMRPSSIEIFDKSTNAISMLQSISRIETKDDLVGVLEKYNQTKKQIEISLILKAFENSIDRLLVAAKKLRQAHWQNIDICACPDQFADLISENTLVWQSNAWWHQSNFIEKNKKQIEVAHSQFVDDVSDRLQLDYFANPENKFSGFWGNRERIIATIFSMEMSWDIENFQTFRSLRSFSSVIAQMDAASPKMNSPSTH